MIDCKQTTDDAENPFPEDPWTPAQFSIKSVLLITTVVAAAVAILRYVGFEHTFLVVLAFSSLWFAWTCLRLVGLGQRRTKADPPHDVSFHPITGEASQTPLVSQSSSEDSP